jgi:hypothetical protein
MNTFFTIFAIETRIQSQPGEVAMPQTIPGSSPDQTAVLTKSTLRAAELLGLRRAQLAGAIGLSPATLSRMYTGKVTLDPSTKSWELATLVVRLYRGLDASLAGDEDARQAWMRNPNTDLRDTPVNLVGKVTGLAHLVAYVDANRARL